MLSLLDNIKCIMGCGPVVLASLTLLFTTSETCALNYTGHKLGAGLIWILGQKIHIGQKCFHLETCAFN